MVLLVAAGFIGNSYEFYAKHRGWPVGRSFADWATGTILIVPIVIAILWYHDGWARALTALGAGFALAFLLTEILRQYVQVLCIVIALGTLVFTGFVGVAWLMK
jgi:hypothetical protein